MLEEYPSPERRTLIIADSEDRESQVVSHDEFVLTERD